eukprot:Hpha_TRINITY_DN34535_c0_g1::TRINITY_DN34535_c0_g1_i1::g.96437::m.96437
MTLQLFVQDDAMQKRFAVEVDLHGTLEDLRVEIEKACGGHVPLSRLTYMGESLGTQSDVVLADSGLSAQALIVLAAAGEMYPTQYADAAEFQKLNPDGSYEPWTADVDIEPPIVMSKQDGRILFGQGFEGSEVVEWDVTCIEGGHSDFYVGVSDDLDLNKYTSKRTWHVRGDGCQGHSGGYMHGGEACEKAGQISGIGTDKTIRCRLDLKQRQFSVCHKGEDTWSAPEFWGNLPEGVRLYPCINFCGARAAKLKFERR